MAIRNSKKAPSGSIRAIEEYLSHRESRPIMEGIDLENVGVTEAYPVYYASLEDLVSGNLPKGPSHWRHVLVTRGRAVGEVDVADDEDGLNVIAIHRGPRAIGTVKALEGARELPRTKRRSYELRMLEGPAIHLVAIWLHSAKDDLLLPVEPDLTGLPHHEPIPLAEAMPALRERAAVIKQAEIDYPGDSGN